MDSAAVMDGELDDECQREMRAAFDAIDRIRIAAQQFPPLENLLRARTGIGWYDLQNITAGLARAMARRRMANRKVDTQ